MWNTIRKLISTVNNKKIDLHKSSFTPNDFALTQLSECFGSPSQAIKVTYDPIQRLVAVYSTIGGIRIFGKVGVEATLPVDLNSQLLHFFFVVNEPFIICVYEDSVQKWSITEKKLITTQKLASKCTTASYTTGSKYLLLGGVTGCIRVLNLDSNYMPSFGISYDQHIKPNIESTEEQTTPQVVAIEASPVDSTLILIGYSNNIVALWDMNGQKLVKSYRTPNGLSTLSFNRNGAKFASGHNTGELAIWNVKESSVKMYFFVAEVEANRKPITRLVWAKSKGENYIIIIGGAKSPSVPAAEGEAPTKKGEGIVVISGNKLRKNADKRKMWFIEPSAGTTVDFVLSFNSPYPTQPDRELKYMVSVTDCGQLMVHNLTRSGFVEIYSPSTHHLWGDDHSSLVCVRSYKDLSASVIAVLKSTSQHKQNDEWPITGGSITPTNTGGRDILVTGHSDGRIHFWQVETSSFTHIHTSSLPPKLRQFEFSPTSGRLLAIYDTVAIFFNLSVSSRAIKVLVYDPTFSQTLPVSQPSSPVQEQTSSPPSQNTASSSRPNPPPVQESSPPKEDSNSQPNTQQETQEQQQSPTPAQQQQQEQQQPQQQQPQSPPQRAPAFFRPPQHHSAGFQQEAEFHLASKLTAGAISEDNRFGLGEENGYAACFTFHDEIDVPIRIISHKKITEGTAITFIGFLGPTHEYPSLSQQFILGTQTGSIGIFDSVTHHCAATFRLTDNSPIIFCQLIDKYGVPITNTKPPVSLDLDTQPSEEPTKSRPSSPPATPTKSIQISGEFIVPPTIPSATSPPTSTPSSPTPPAEQQQPQSAPSSRATSPSPSPAPSTEPLSTSSSPPSPTPTTSTDLVPPTSNEFYIVAASEREIHVFSRVPHESTAESKRSPPSSPPPPSDMFAFERVSKTEARARLSKVAIVKYFGNNECCVVGCDVNGGIHVYTLLDLNRAISIPSNSSEVSYTPGDEGIIYGQRPEGIFKASIFSAEFRPVPPALYVEGVSMPSAPKSGGVLKSLFGKSNVSLDELIDREDTPVQAPTPSTTSSSSSSSSQSADGEERPKARTIDEIKAKYGRPSTSSTLDALQQAKQALNERGEKLQELSDKTADMEDASKQFLENIKKLKEKQQSSWW